MLPVIEKCRKCATVCICIVLFCVVLCQYLFRSNFICIVLLFVSIYLEEVHFLYNFIFASDLRAIYLCRCMLLGWFLAALSKILHFSCNLIILIYYCSCSESTHTQGSESALEIRNTRRTAKT